MPGDHEFRMTRRRAMGGAAAVGVGAPLLAACGGEDSGSDTVKRSGVRIATDDVPVGDTTILEDEQVLVAQPSEGEFRVFSSICTHENCPITQIADGTANCSCHGSRFDAADGTVVQGPAEKPLEELDFTVEVGEIVLS